MFSPQYPTQQYQTDQTANFFWLMIISTAVFLIVWYFAPQWIITPIYVLRYYELLVIKHVVQLWQPIAQFFHIPAFNLHILDAIEQHILSTNPKTEHFANFAYINHNVGHWTRYPVIVVLLVMAYIINFRKGVNRFRHEYTIKDLRKLEAKNWPVITPVLSLNLVRQDPSKGPWAMAKLPLDFCRENHLVGVTTTGKKQKKWSIDRAAAQRLFTLQLGPLWRGPHSLPLHVQALIVIFLSRAERERKTAKALLEQIALSSATGRLNFQGVSEALKRFEHSKILPWLAKRHAYVYTVMASLLEIARNDGVIATSEFLWLKPLDRRLWYVLNNVGRQTCVIETAGPFSHWVAEKKITRALKTPMVKEAVTALEKAMDDILFVDEGERWHTPATSNVA